MDLAAVLKPAVKAAGIDLTVKCIVAHGGWRTSGASGAQSADPKYARFGWQIAPNRAPLGHASNMGECSGVTATSFSQQGPHLPHVSDRRGEPEVVVVASSGVSPACSRLPRR